MIDALKLPLNLPASFKISEWRMSNSFVGYVATLTVEANCGLYANDLAISYAQMRMFNGSPATLVEAQVQIAYASMLDTIRRERWLTPFRWLLNVLRLQRPYNRAKQAWKDYWYHRAYVGMCEGCFNNIPHGIEYVYDDDDELYCKLCYDARAKLDADPEFYK
jgi:hypothetical protein